MNLSADVLAICRTYWRRLPSGRLAATCCAGCPLAAPCGESVAPTAEALAAHVGRLNVVASAVAGVDPAPRGKE